MSLTSSARIGEIAIKFALLAPAMDERQTRLWLATEARALGRGGIAAVTTATGILGKRIGIGMRELKQMERTPPTEPARAQRVRRPGAGRKRATEKDPTLLRDLESLVDPVTRGDPESPLRWTTKSVRKLAAELREMGHEVGKQTVSELLHDLDYSLQALRKTREGSSHPDRNAQFEYINRQARAFQAKDQPVISVDTKKKELVGDFRNGGREWQRKGEPEPVRVHDFIDSELGKAIPYGVYDVARNEGWVNVGIDHDTGEFAVESIRRWWWRMGRYAYPNASELLITADGGGSNGSRTRLWKLALQQFASASGLQITVAHYPPGTSKWNKIEHRLFCHITENWRGRPLESLQTVVNLIANTTTTTGLRVKAAADTRSYKKGIRVSDAEIETVNLKRHRFHGDWNYAIGPLTS
jgi:transposase